MMTRLRSFTASPTMLAAFIVASVSLLTLFSTPSRAQQPTWAMVPSGRFLVPNGYWITSIWATNPQTVVIGWHWNNTSAAGMVMRTTDGGQTWKNCTIPA